VNLEIIADLAYQKKVDGDFLLALVFLTRLQASQALPDNWLAV